MLIIKLYFSTSKEKERDKNCIIKLNHIHFMVGDEVFHEPVWLCVGKCVCVCAMVWTF